MGVSLQNLVPLKESLMSLAVRRLFENPLTFCIYFPVFLGVVSVNRFFRKEFMRARAALVRGLTTLNIQVRLRRLNIAKSRGYCVA